MVEFSIIGDKLDHELITEKLGIAPNEIGSKGEKIRDNLTRIENYWTICTGSEETYDINEQLYKIVALIQDKREILKDIKTNFKSGIHFYDSNLYT